MIVFVVGKNDVCQSSFSSHIRSITLQHFHLLFLVHNYVAIEELLNFTKIFFAVT